MNKRKGLHKLVLIIATLAMLCVGLIAYFFIFPGLTFLGFFGAKEYLVLFQNDMEQRATGGFMGSYARVRMERGRFQVQKIEDIYTPDGQLEGHVDPPWPIQMAFGQGWWKLRDSNWDPDFPTAAKNIEWFFVHGKEPVADGLITVNLKFLASLLKISGDIYVLDQPEAITSTNFYKKTQAAVEVGFFPGSSQKRDFLNALGRSLLAQVLRFNFWQKIKVASEILSLLRSKDIYLYAHDQHVQALWERLDFAGSLPRLAARDKNYLSFFESNLGANKANCCVKRKVDVRVGKMGTKEEHKVLIHYENQNPASFKNPPQIWGGTYVNFLRVGIPIGADVRKIKVGDLEYPTVTSPNSTQIDLKPEKGIKFVGFFVIVDALSSENVELVYQI